MNGEKGHGNTQTRDKIKFWKVPIKYEILSLIYLNASKAMFMLVMYLAPDGNNKDQVKYMHGKATTW